TVIFHELHFSKMDQLLHPLCSGCASANVCCQLLDEWLKLERESPHVLLLSSCCIPFQTRVNHAARCWMFFTWLDCCWKNKQ
ncbi:hypothetical protein VIGAN_05250000, partial [Vigna angularis var. angularis]